MVKVHRSRRAARISRSHHSHSTIGPRNSRPVLSRALAAACFLLMGCKSATLHGETTSANETGPALQVVATGSASSVVRPTWKVAVAEQRWRDAAFEFDREYPHPTDPGHRYVRARIASELDDFERVVDLLNGLDVALPEFTNEIRALRAGAQLRIGPYDAAAQYFQTQSDGETRLDAARAWVKANRLDEALAVLTRSRPLFTGKTPSLEAAFRSLHAEVLTGLGRHGRALEEYTWIALEAPTSKYAREAVLKLTSGNPKRILTKSERFRRMGALAQAGELDAVLEEERALATAPGSIPSVVGVKRHLAWAYYQSRRDYGKAAKLFEECARNDSSQIASDLFYSARALSRAHRDQEAIARYEMLIRKQPGSKHAVTAKQLIGRLWFAQGEWASAVAAYDSYLAKYSNSKHHRAAISQARQERAIALLALADRRALPALEDLLRRSETPQQRAHLLELLGVAQANSGNIEQARLSFEEVIATRPLSFSALAAAARLRALGLPVPPELTPASPEDSVVSPPLTIDLPKRATQLIDWGLDSDAESELAAANGVIFDAYAPRAGEAACQAFGRLATAKERYRKGQKVIRERAVQRVVTPATRWAWDCLYPRPYPATVTAAASRHGVDPAVIYAVMRQESGFHPTIASPAAAHGLMQIIEPTAKSLAAELGLAYSKDDLLTPEYNIELGSRYLSKLLQRFDGQLALAAAAYNAGPHAATRWLETAPQLPLDLFVARILYEETRTYVQRVVANWARYRYLEGGLAQIPQLNLSLPMHKALVAGDY